MKKLYQILRTAILCVVGVFAGTSVYQYIDYRQRPGLYALTSAPWYTSLQIGAVFTAAVVLIPLIAMRIVKRKLKETGVMFFFEEIKKPPVGRLFAIFRLNPSPCTFSFR